MSVLSAVAQNPAELLDNWSARSPIEKIYLQFDRDNYVAGETVWFKSYLYSDYQPDTISTSLYVELVNDSGIVLSRSIVPVLLGTSSGHLEIPVSATRANYIVRAYTPTQLNHDPGFIYKKQLAVFGKAAVQIPREKMTRLEFFPEGGNLVSGLSQTIAFKATNEYGLPVQASGSIYNSKNEKIATFNSYHDGMGMFDLLSTVNEKYYAIADGETRRYDLPEPAAKGIGLTIIPHPQGNFFEIKQRKEDPAFQVAYMIGQMQHHVVFRQEFKNFKEQINGVINTKSLHSGILQVTFFNKDNQPLAERLCFVNNKEYIQQGELIADTISFGVKARNRISIQLKDTVQGSFSVSVIDGAFQQNDRRADNIYSSLLLTGDLQGYIHQPSYYFSADNDSVQTSLDLVMMTNGWRRFKWMELAKQPAPGYRDRSFITLSGKVNLRDSKKTFASKPLLLMLMTADSTRRIQMISTDEQGNFKLDSMLFFGRSKVFVSDIRGKKSQYIDVNMSADSLTRSYLLPAVLRPPYQPTVLQEQQVKLGIDLDEILKGEGLLMKGVTVKTKKRNLVQELDEKYAKGAFSGEANRILDLVNNKDAETYQNIFEYLRMNVPGLQVAGSIGDYQIFYRQTVETGSSLGPIPMQLFLDEIETDASVISNIPAGQVAMVKVYSSFVGAMGNGAGGVLAVYTKKGSDMSDIMQYAADMIPYNGYTVVKEYYEPDYKADPAAMSRPDHRVSLAWRPDVLINNINPKIPVTFYNSDRTRSYRIVVEGMTLDGKMLMIEKWIGPKGF
jgi:hypothetical protein